MIVKCIGRSFGHLSADRVSAHYRENVHVDEENISVGSLYIVYGVAFRGEFPWYLICEYEGDDYPRPHFSRLFEIVDDRIPPGWSFRLDVVNVGQAAVLPVQWARDPSFFEKLVDGNPDALSFFKSLKSDMDKWHFNDS
jgi:hypothetical protein